MGYFLVQATVHDNLSGVYGRWIPKIGTPGAKTHNSNASSMPNPYSSRIFHVGTKYDIEGNSVLIVSKASEITIKSCNIT